MKKFDLTLGSAVDSRIHSLSRLFVELLHEHEGFQPVQWLLLADGYTDEINVLVNNVSLRSW